MQSELTEGPLAQPTQDRLGMPPHAKKLARLIARSALPMTVGIYGPWGAGKTTFANFLVTALREQLGWDELNLIYFSAWPYTTPTAIWQALVEQIARTVYQQDAPENAVGPPPSEHPATLTQQLRKALLSEAVTLTAKPADPRRDSYDKIVRRLSSSAGIADRTPSPQLGGLTLGAFAKLVLSAAATMAPPLGPVSQLLSGTGGSAQAVAAPTSLESIEQIRADLRSVFAEAGQTHNVVLIDDLDRCHPEIALDVLETIKIFFAESAGSGSSWLFLVPADEQLVGQGLRARLGNQPERADDLDARAYLEKIVQVGVVLPEVRAESAHSLIADYLPDWAGASDLLVCAFNGNPRRIKQQGALLSYRYPGDADRSGLSEDDATALAKLVSLQARREQPDNGTQELLAQALSLRDSDSDLGRVDPETLRVLASVADLRPGPGGAPQGADRVFSYVAALTADQDGSTKPHLLAVTYIRQLLEIRERGPAFFGRLAACAADDASYLGLVSRFDSWLDCRLADEGAEAAADVRDLAELAVPLLNDDKARLLLAREPRLSAIPAAVVRVVSADSTKVPEATVVSGMKFDPFTAAADAIADAHQSQVEMTATRLRLAVASDVIDRRKFAKVQLLLTRWPELVRLARGPGGVRRLRDLEAAVLRGDQYASVPESWKRLAANEDLQEFMQLPPSIAQCYGEDVSAIADNSAAGALIPESLSVPLATAFAYGSPAAAAVTAPAGDVYAGPAAGDAYANLTLAVTPVGGTEERVTRNLSAAPPDEPVEAEITLTLHGSYPTEARAFARVPVDEILRLTRPLADGRYAAGLGDPGRPASLSLRDLLADIGAQLWSSTFGASADCEALFARAFETQARLRIAVVSSADKLTALPWECLFLPRYGIFAAQTLKLSVVRQIPEPAPLPSPRLGRPMRILVAEASPQGLPVLGAEQEISLIDKSLEQARQAGLVRIEVIRGATLDKLWSAIQSFKPHVLHYVGHAGFDETSGLGALLLEDDDGRPSAAPADRLGVMMQERGVLLAVLNGCQTGWPSAQELSSSPAQTLVRSGIPAAIGTTRDVADTAALRFAGEFYRSLGDGLAAEPALVEARKALSVKGWDWSMYAMYANTEFPLHTIRIQPA